MKSDPALRLMLECDPAGTLRLVCPGWPGFRLPGLCPRLKFNGRETAPGARQKLIPRPVGKHEMKYSFARAVTLTLTWEALASRALRLRAILCNAGTTPMVLNHVTLLGTPAHHGTGQFGPQRDSLRIMEQGNYWARIRTFPEPPPAGDTKPPAAAAREFATASEFVTVLYSRTACKGFLAGFESSERWQGRIVSRKGASARWWDWCMEFDGGDLQVDPGETIPLESILLLAGPDPWRLLEEYADIVARRFKPRIPATPPVSWCSWYPYRLGITEARVLANARIAARRLKPLGLRIMEVDLGWEKGYLPSQFEENDQFPHGLKWLANRLHRYGFDLGVWKAPFTISEFDPLARQHPEWLIQDDKGVPACYWTWFWKPFGKVFILDLTHPGAQQWLRRKIHSLHARGVRYLKSDFIGCVSGALAKRRYNPKLVMGGGTEAARLGARIIREAMPGALLLNCGGPEMPGQGHWPLLYTCNDTGNTGTIRWNFQQDNFLTAACHLFKNNRWGVIQPSCLCVGLPGTLEEARLRATVAFLAGGQVDISDTFITLPEDRWEVLAATLPPLGQTATPIDLFEPVYGTNSAGTTRGREDDRSAAAGEHPPGSVWHLHLQRDWDEWDLVGLLAFQSPATADVPPVRRFVIPLARLGLARRAALWAYEFWGRQFLGRIPFKRRNPRGYEHPGDFQDLTTGDSPGTLDIAFTAPAAKLICLRTPRPHPWILGTSFHQGCGAELKDVEWNRRAGHLTGTICRPAGTTGQVAITAAGRNLAMAEVDGRRVPVHPGANGSWILPVMLRANQARWRIRFR